MFNFGLCSTSDDWPSDPSNKSQLKCKKRPPKSSKNEMLSFGLCSNSDDQRSNRSNESQPTNSEWPISHDSQLLQSFLTKVAQNGQFHTIYNFSNLFPLKWLRMTRNGQFHPICNFSNLFSLKWLRMTCNG